MQATVRDNSSESDDSGCTKGATPAMLRIQLGDEIRNVFSFDVLHTIEKVHLRSKYLLQIIGILEVNKKHIDYESVLKSPSTSCGLKP